MELKKVIEERRSIRLFLPEAVPREDLKELIRLATLAPSAGNTQGWHFMLITTPEKIKQLGNLVENKLNQLEAMPAMQEYREAFTKMRHFALFFREAPAVIAVLKEPYSSKTEEILAKLGKSREEILQMRSAPDIQSLGAAIQTLLLAAWAMGYGTCWMTAPLFAKEEMEEFLKITPPRRLSALIPLGKPAESPPARPRKPLSEVLSWL